MPKMRKARRLHYGPQQRFARNATARSERENSGHMHGMRSKEKIIAFSINAAMIWIKEITKEFGFLKGL
jgi:hypothetical protein